MSKDDQVIRPRKSATRQTAEMIAVGLLVGYLSYHTVHLFGLELGTDSLWLGPTSKLNFTLDQFNRFLTNSITASIVLGAVSLASVSVYALYQ